MDASLSVKPRDAVL